MGLQEYSEAEGEVGKTDVVYHARVMSVFREVASSQQGTWLCVAPRNDLCCVLSFEIMQRRQNHLFVTFILCIASSLLTSSIYIPGCIVGARGISCFVSVPISCRIVLPVRS